MKIAIEQVASCVRRLTIEVPTDRVNRELNTVYNTLQKRVKIPGFRQGKIPRPILENYYRQSIEQEVLRKLVPEALSEALIKESVQSVGEPQIDQIALAKDQPLRFVATTQVIPEFTLADYSGWQFERRIPVVTETQIDQGMEQLRERHAILQAVEGRTAQQGDFVLVNYTGVLDGRPVPGAEGNHVTIEIGSGRFLPEIEQGLLGMASGSEKTIPIEFPANYREAILAGKTLQFRIDLVEIKEKVLPELDDDFARQYEEVESLAALRGRVRTELEEVMRQQADAALRRDILTRLVAAHPIDVPTVLLQDQMRRAYLQDRRQETGEDLTDADYQIDPETLSDRYGEQALEMVRGQLILRRIGEEAELTVTPEEVDSEIAALASRAAQNPEALKKAMERNGTLSNLEASLHERKIFAAILANVQVTDRYIHETALASDAEQG